MSSKTLRFQHLSIALLLALCLLSISACRNSKTGEAAATGPGGGSTSESVLAVTDEPGMDFKKTVVGLQSHTLDYVGTEPDALAGAKQAAKIYFGKNDGGTTRIFCRDLKSGKRNLVSEISDLVPGSMICSSDGRYLVYGRYKQSEHYIEDPDSRFPERISVLYRYDVESKEETELFDFRGSEFMRFRADKHDCFVTPDGSVVAAVAIDLDHLIVKKQVMDWLNLADDVQGGKPDMTDEEKTENIATLRQLYQSARFASLLKERGVTPPPSGAITPEERKAMEAIFFEYNQPAYSLLTWRDGAASSLPLVFEEDLQLTVHYLVALSNDQVVMGTRDPAPKASSPYYLFTTDLQTGQLRRIGQYDGAPSVMELNPGSNELLIVNNPYDPAANEISADSYLLRVPLDGSGVQKTALGANLLGYADITTDGSLIVAQEVSDHYLYAVEPASGKKTLLTRFVAEAGGIFLPEDKERVSYLENGLLYALNIAGDPQKSKDWVAESYFDPYRQKFVDALSSLGFTVPADAKFEFEERDGLGAHEVSASLINPADPQNIVLLRWSVESNKLVSLWMPGGYPFPNSKYPAQTAELDFYDCRDIAEKVMNDAAWLSPDSREVYQPGPNPLYDGKTGTFVVLFRDGYYFGPENEQKWVINREATVSIRKTDGTLVEMTLNERDPVEDQPMTITLEQATDNARNKGKDPIPSTAPVEFDTENYRLVIAEKPVDQWGPVKYQIRRDSRVCYEIDMFIQPENELVMTTLVDTETGDVLGQLSFSPTSIGGDIVNPNPAMPGIPGAGG